ncbi:MAG: C-terminal target protein [Spirosoma sp.]|nr:C-terminal target protein [Spirosoma sp.]
MKTIYLTAVSCWLTLVWLMSMAISVHALPMTPPAGHRLVEPDGKQSTALTPGIVKMTKIEGSLSLTQPTYNCQTGAIIFNTTGGDGSPITYSAPGITRSSLTSNTGTVEQELRNDPKPITITAMQNGQMASYSFDFGAYCTNPRPLESPMSGPLTLLAPTYDCTTGAFHFNTSGGNGTLIEYWAAPGITGWTTNPNQFVDMESRWATDVKPFTLMARQSGVLVTYVWNLRAVCPNPPAANPLTLLAPSYDCATGAFRFNTSGGNGTLIEYWAAPGITGWTTNPNQFVDRESRTADDVKPFTLMARQSGVLVTYVWNLKATCGRARMPAEEPKAELQVQVLGNPVASKTAEVEIRGVSGQAVQLNLMDQQGRVLHQQTINQAGSTERVSVPIDNGRGLLLLTVSTDTQRQQIKLVRP